jgi:hypothetical protein
MSIEDFDCPMCGSEIQLTLLSIVIIKMGRKGDALTNEFISIRNILTKETESWRGFTDSLKSEEDKKLPKS